MTFLFQVDPIPNGDQEEVQIIVSSKTFDLSRVFLNNTHILLQIQLFLKRYSSASKLRTFTSTSLTARRQAEDTQIQPLECSLSDDSSFSWRWERRIVLLRWNTKRTDCDSWGYHFDFLHVIIFTFLQLVLEARYYRLPNFDFLECANCHQWYHSDGLLFFFVLFWFSPIYFSNSDTSSSCNFHSGQYEWDINIEAKVWLDSEESFPLFRILFNLMFPIGRKLFVPIMERRSAFKLVRSLSQSFHLFPSISLPSFIISLLSFFPWRFSWILFFSSTN